FPMMRKPIVALAALSLAGCATAGGGSGILGTGVTAAQVNQYVGAYCGLQAPIAELTTLISASAGESVAVIGQIICGTYKSVTASAPPAAARLGAKLSRTIVVNGVTL